MAQLSERQKILMQQMLNGIYAYCYSPFHNWWSNRWNDDSHLLHWIINIPDQLKMQDELPLDAVLQK